MIIVVELIDYGVVVSSVRSQKTSGWDARFACSAEDVARTRALRNTISVVAAVRCTWCVASAKTRARLASISAAFCTSSAHRRNLSTGDWTTCPVRSTTSRNIDDEIVERERDWPLLWRWRARRDREPCMWRSYQVVECLDSHYCNIIM